MSLAINKNTLQVVQSADTKRFPEKDWLINPKLPDCHSKYWIIRAGVLSEMDAVEKKDVDDALAEYEKDTQKEILIMEKQEAISRTAAIKALKDDGVLDADGNLIGG